MSAYWKNVRRSTWAATLLLWIALFGVEAHGLWKSTKYSTPWYSSSWLEQPVTNFYLSFFESREYTTTNAIKSEIWRVREVRVGDAMFWTTLERKPIF